MSGLYIHIPFCAQKCIYCDFYSIVSNKYLEQYLICVVKELEMRKNELNEDEINTIYIGGGTPSLIPGHLLRNFINSIWGIIKDKLNLREFTIEVNPDDITPEYCSFIRDCGINRVSMGVQSFDDSELNIIKRRHDSKQAMSAYRMLKDSGINNISIDLIYGLPGQTLKTWENTLNIAMSLRPNHISVYSLMYEEGTLLYRMRKDGRITECSDEDYLSMDNLLQKTLKENGYLRYEISNYSLPGFESIHNSNYWNSTPYLGIGAGAHSFDGKVRRYNPNSVKNYIDTIKEGHTFYVEEKESQSEIYNDYVMTHLRTVKGIDIKELKTTFGLKYWEHFNEISKKYILNGEMIERCGFVSIDANSFMISDAIISDLFFD